MIHLFVQGIQSRSDDSEPDNNEYTNHKRQYTEITRTPPAPVREPAEDEYEDQQ